MTRRRRVLTAAAIAAAVGAGALPAAARVRAGHAAPEFALPDLAGATHALSAERGRIVLLDFWASWCAPCAEELACLEELRRQDEDSVRLIAVTIDRDADTARRFLDRRDAGRGATVLHDGGSDVLSEYGADGLPALYLIDRDGVVRAVHDGAGGCLAVAAELEALLGRAPPADAPPPASP